MSTEPADLLIEARWILPIAPDNMILEDHAVAITAGRIVALGPTASMNARFQPRQRVIRRNHILMPGFVNAHTRAASTLFRGRRVRALRGRWPGEAAGPAEARFVDADFVRDGTQLAIAEMLTAGITSFADMYQFPEEAAKAAAAVRMRAAIGLPLTDVPGPWAQNTTAYFARAERLWDQYKSDPWVCLYFAPQAAELISDATLERVRRVADELDARVAMAVGHSGSPAADPVASMAAQPRISEPAEARTQDRAASTGAASGDEASCVQRLYRLGLLQPGFTAVHLTHLNEADFEIVARTGIGVVACPQADLRLGGGCCPVSRLDDEHVTVGFGTGDPATAGAMDILSEARVAALFTTGSGGTSLSAVDVLRMATLGGATAMGLGAVTGSIEAGKSADLVCWDLDTLGCQPALHPEDSLLFGATRQQARDVWTCGRAAVSDGQLLGFDREALVQLRARWQQRTNAGGPA